MFTGGPIIVAPGFSKVNTRSMLQTGRLLRDEYVWDYPILPGAVYTYQQMASGREWSVSGTERSAARALEWLNSAVTKTSDGLVVYGLDSFLKRRVLDYLAVGRTLLYAPQDGSLEYLDPCFAFYNAQNNVWEDSAMQRVFNPDDVRVDHPIPIGGSGNFVSPLSCVMPAAMLAWLIREHDRAAVDGRKIRDVVIVYGKDLAEQIRQAIEQMINIWSGADPSKIGIPVVYTESPFASQKSADDLLTTIGISRIPDGFDRSRFETAYVNEIAATLGLSLRHFWNSEASSNRALEEVQEARQMQKGPSSFVRREQRIYNDLLKRFGRRTRMAFDEEVDVQSREVNAKVLKLYSESMVLLNRVFGGIVDGTMFLAWLQGEGILPADIEISSGGQIEQSDGLITPIGELRRVNSDPDLYPEIGKSAEDLEYDEVRLSSSGDVLDRRRRVFTIEKIIQRAVEKDPDWAADSPQLPTFEEIVAYARKESQKLLLDAFTDDPQSAANRLHVDTATLEKLALTPLEQLTVEEQRLITQLTAKL